MTFLYVLLAVRGAESRKRCYAKSHGTKSGLKYEPPPFEHGPVRPHLKEHQRDKIVSPQTMHICRRKSSYMYRERQP
ncbi:hypothetical protein K491DRAFT_484510 [Lophiostoma macrostomum CBS 122681]|uniref:Uncharacterized protein n=1 Tax=Lophiostoma macrostomum CBS 122681 TaxID=1314788 RepID=A0A6A6T396_9PLEO|nr:hypothetical protein K491DRAFT_484510 [Lophiostoma macrostomum CBS 122681]